ncbi:hypothetical protein C8T65DRAFT_574267 [Cerioporus squamosus]|nr:hypothetical protein C8T65DRAFT_574267 [Cerioporus squamosus]
MPFHTIFAPDRRVALAWWPDVRDVLGWRWPQSTYSHYDYLAYEDRVRGLLRGPKARAALLAGGIVWRLALELLGGLFLDDAAKGPSPDVYRYNEQFRPDVGDDFLDDKLSSDELDIVCGTYRVILSQTEDRSWWPKPSTWHESDFDLGRWTPWCEKWFLTRLSKIQCGEEQPKKTGDWKQGLRQCSQARKLRSVLEIASNKWLHDIMQVPTSPRR